MSLANYLRSVNIIAPPTEAYERLVIEGSGAPGAPTGQGITDAATLTGRGVTVTTN